MFDDPASFGGGGGLAGASVAGWAQAVAMFAVVGVAAWTDGRKRRVANRLCLAGLALGLALSFARGGWSAGPVSLKTSLAAAGVAFVAFMFFYALGGMAAGDVKLMAAVGALAANLTFLLWIVVYAALAGIPLAVAALWARGDVAGGLGRGLRQMGRWRFPTPPPDGRPAWKPRAASAGKTLPAPPPSSAARLTGPSAETPEPAATAIPDAKCASAPEAPGTTAATASAGKDKDAVFVPYAVAIFAGLAWASIQYGRRGLALPFFW